LNSWRGLLKSKQRGKAAKKLDVCFFVFETVYKISGLDLREYPGAVSFEKDSRPVIRINSDRGGVWILKPDITENLWVIQHKVFQ
jgi:hypothetical protein